MTGKEHLKGFLRFVRLWFKLWRPQNDDLIRIALTELGKVRADLKRRLQEKT